MTDDRSARVKPPHRKKEEPNLIPQRGAAGTPGPTGPAGAAGAPGPSNQIDESSGPTSLAVGAIANGQFTKRVGTTFVGATLAAVATSGAAADVSGLAAIATSGSASDLGAGTVPLARLSGITDTEIAAAAGIVLTKLATIAAARILGNNTGGASVPLELTAAQVKTLLAIAAGDVSGLATIATSGSASDLSTGTVPLARLVGITNTEIAAAAAIVLTKIANQADLTILGNNVGAPGPPIALTAAQVRTLLALATIATSGSASDLGAGTVPLARLTGITDTQVAAANKDGAAATASMRTLGTGAAQACAGNDSRLSDTRSPATGTVVTASIAAGAVTGAKLAALGIQISGFALAASGSVSYGIGACRNGYVYLGTQTTPRVYKYHAKSMYLAASVTPPSAAAFSTKGAIRWSASLSRFVCQFPTGFALYDPSNDTFGSLITTPTAWGQLNAVYNEADSRLYYAATGSRIARCDSAGANQSNGGAHTNGCVEVGVDNTGAYAFSVENNGASAGKLYRYVLASWPTLGASITLGAVVVTGVSIVVTAANKLVVGQGTAGLMIVDPITFTTVTNITLSGTNSPAGMIYDSTTDRIFVSETTTGKIWVLDGTTFDILVAFNPDTTGASQATLAYDPVNGVLWVGTHNSTTYQRFYT